MAEPPYGEVIAESGSTENPFTWHGRFGVLRDGDLYSMRARWYDSISARFLSRAPIRGNDPVRANPYQALFGDPIALVDPRGTDPEGTDLFAVFKLLEMGNGPLTNLAVLLAKEGVGILGGAPTEFSDADDGGTADSPSSPLVAELGSPGSFSLTHEIAERVGAAGQVSFAAPAAMPDGLTNVASGHASYGVGRVPASDREAARKFDRAGPGEGAMGYGGAGYISDDGEREKVDWLWFGLTPAGKLLYEWWKPKKCPPHPATGVGCLKPVGHPGLHVNNGWGKNLSWP